MRTTLRIAAAAALVGILLAAGCSPGTTTGSAKGPARGRPTMYEFSTDS